MPRTAPTAIPAIAPTDNPDFLDGDCEPCSGPGVFAGEVSTEREDDVESIVDGTDEVEDVLELCEVMEVV